MKKKIYIVPLLGAVIVLCFTALVIIQALAVESTLPFVGEGGLFQRPTRQLLGLSYHQFALVCGILTTIVTSVFRRSKYNFNVLQAVLFSVFFLAQAFLGAKLMFATERITNANSFSAFDMSGYSLYGAIIMSIVFIPVIAALWKKKKAVLYDCAAIHGITFLAFARFGCFVSGCCGSEMQMVNGKPFYLPVQLLEVVYDLLILTFLSYLEQKKLSWGEKDERLNFYNGSLFFFMLILYGLGRFTLEFWRLNTKVFWGMTFAQIYSLAVIMIGVIVLFKRKQAHDWMLEKQKRHAQKHPGRR